MREFSLLHPLVCAAYFAAVLGFSMVLMHPACLLISLVSGTVCMAAANRGKPGGSWYFFIPLALGTALLNPLFNHEGVTILGYLPDGNPLTLESIAYGAAAAVMLAAVLCHFSVFHRVMTGEKWMYLFGRLAPSLSLVLSMTLRFVPRFRVQLKEVLDAQRGVGRGISDGSLLRRLRGVISVVSVMMTWSLENAAETADSMKSRGYGAPGRTSYTGFRFTRRDAASLALLCVLTGYVLIGGITGGLYFRYFPSMRGAALSPYGCSVLAAYLALCLFPVGFEGKEALRWKKLRSKI